MKVRYCFWVASIFFLIFSTTVLAKDEKGDYERPLEICERYYEEGAYEKALDLIKKTMRKTASDGFTRNMLRMYRAKYEEAMGLYDKFELSVQRTLEEREKFDGGKNTMRYAYGILDAAYIYLIYTDYNTSEKYLNQAKEVFANLEGAEKDDYVKAQMLYIETKIALSRGLYELTLSKISDLLPVIQTRIRETEIAYNVSSDAYVEKNLTAYEQRRRKRKYAEILTLKGETQRRQGKYEEAQQTLTEADEWIKGNLENNGVSYVNNRHEEILLLLDQGIDIEAAKGQLEKNFFLAERRLGVVHKDFLKIHEAVIDYYIESRYIRKGRIQQFEINTNTSKFYGLETTQNAIALRLEAKRDFYAKRFASANVKLQSLYSDSTKVPTNHIERIRMLKQFYDVSIAMDNYLEAKEYLDELLELQGSLLGLNSLDFHYTRVEQANYYLTYTNRFNSADSLLKSSFNGVIKNRITPEHKDYIPFLRDYSEYYKTIGKYDSAQVLANQIVEINKSKYGESHHQYAIGLETLIDVYLATGEYKEANNYVNAMLKVFDENRYKRRRLDTEYSQVLETSARYYATLGAFNTAQDNLNRANRLNQRNPTATANSTAIDELAYVYIKTGRYDETERMLEEAVEVRKERYGEDSRFLITPYNQLARLAYIKGDYTAADDLVNQALAIAIESFGENSLQTVESYSILGDLFSARGDYETAKSNIQNVIEIEKKAFGEDHVELANSYTQLALVKYYNGEELAEIEALFNQAVKIVSENLGEDNPIYAVALKNLSLVFTENDKPDEAIGLLNQANEIWVRRLGTELNINSAEIELLIGDIETKRRAFQAAIDHYEVAQNVYKKVFNKEHPDYVRSISKLGRTYFALGDINKSEKYIDQAIANYFNYIDRFFPALSEREKQQYWNKIRNDFEFYYTLAFSNADNEELVTKAYNNTIQTKGILLNSSLKIRNRIVNSSDSTLKANFQAWNDKKSRLLEVLSMSSEQQKAEGEDPNRIEKEIEDLEKKLSQNTLFSGIQSEDEISDWRQIQQSLRSDEASVEMVPYRYYDGTNFTDSIIYAAIILTPQTEKTPELVFIGNGNFLQDEAFNIYKSSVEYELEDPESYTYFWKPLEEKLPPSKDKKIYFSRGGVYNQINLEGLLANEEGQYIIDLYNILYVGDTKEVAKRTNTGEVAQSSTTNDDVILIGNPVFYADLDPKQYDKVTNRPIPQLPGASVEVQQVNNLLNKESSIHTQLYLHKSATEDTVKNLPSPKTLHFATHGFFLSDESVSGENDLNQEKAVTNPLLRSGLILANGGDLMATNDVYSFNKRGGVLTAFEVMNMDLDNTDLVVLSACETGKGDVKVGEGVYGLQRAFLVAGADVIIMSLFKVDDEATKKLLTNFYENWQVKQMDMRTAFSEAKISLKEEYQEPRYWSPFVMVGKI